MTTNTTTAHLVEPQDAEVCPIVDPVGRPSSGRVPAVPGLGTLRGRTLAVLDISKVRSDIFVGAVADDLAGTAGAAVSRGLVPGSQALPPEELERVAAENDAAVLALADCGTCGSWSLLDAIELHRQGCRAVLVTTVAQRPVLAAMLDRLGMPDLPMVEVPKANRELDPEEISVMAHAAYEAIAAALRG